MASASISLRERLADLGGVVDGIGVRALGEQDPDELAGALALGGRGKGGRGDLVGGEAGRARPAEHLGHDPGQGLLAAPLGRPVGHVGPGAVAAGDVAGVGQALVDRPDRVRIHPQCAAQLADGRQAGARQEPAGVDLVGDLPEDLGADRDVRITLDVEAAMGG